jgi:sulfur relay (sulfurtransferase) DsrF/TusC family protein
MENEHKIPLRELCTHYKIETSFVQSLNEYGLVEITRVDDIECVSEANLPDIEMMIHLHYDLEINFEGLDAILHMLHRIKEMQKEMTTLRNKLNQGW